LQQKYTECNLSPNQWWWKELSRSVQIAGIGWKACRRRNWVPTTKSFFFNT